ncbi:ComEC/Rec2 family competence protein [Halobacillus seohaensis]|uniref:ComEC/Rec2 family competence protein n=1 Tax=Halobacillus seohaensis TaxID=447421 RepID=A0ABW2EIP9_9BACI
MESDLLKKYPHLKSEVLKVGHHGSNTSTSKKWLEMLDPTVALISAGQDNRYGHPHDEVTELLESQDVFIFRTDLHGAVSFKYNKENGTFSTHIPYDAEGE